MRNRVVTAVLLAFAVAACGCGERGVAELGAAAQAIGQENFSWIYHPAELDEDHYGTTNCSPQVSGNPKLFGFGGNSGCSIEVQHDYSACFERETGHDGWIRQHIQLVHCAFVARCNGPGDISSIRLCRIPPGFAASQAGSFDAQETGTPCGIEGFSGPQGCGNCVSQSPVCH